MFSKPKWRWINLIAFVCMVTVNALAELIPIGGMTTGQISALYRTPLTPAPVTFGIWGVIYAALAIFLLIQFFAGPALSVTDRLGPWFLVSCIANILWMLTWHARAIGPALLLMVALLVSLAQIERRLRPLNETAKQRWIIRLPFGMYYGWITVATISNVSVWLKSLNFGAFGLPRELVLTLVLLIGAVIISFGIWKNRDVVYGVAGIWGYAGIMIGSLSLEIPIGFWTTAALVLSFVLFVFAGIAVIFACPFEQMVNGKRLYRRFRN